MRRRSWVLALLGIVVAMLATAVPARASEGHCGDEAVSAAPVTVHEHATVAPAHVSTLARHHAGCPDCPTKSCSAMHGCSVVATPAPSASALRIAALPDARDASPRPAAVPRSHVASPPTPPPLTPLSTLA